MILITGQHILNLVKRIVKVNLETMGMDQRGDIKQGLPNIPLVLIEWGFLLN